MVKNQVSTEAKIIQKLKLWLFLASFFSLCHIPSGRGQPYLSQLPIVCGFVILSKVCLLAVLFYT